MRHPRLLLVVSGLPGGRRVLASRRWFCIRTLGIVFQVPAGGRPIDGALMEHSIGTTLVRKANRLGSQRVIGELLLGYLSRGMQSDLFSESGHRYTSSSGSSERGPVLCSLSCCSHSCLCCRASMYSLSSCWSRARRRPCCHCTCAIQVRILFRLSASRCRWSLPARSS